MTPGMRDEDFTLEKLRIAQRLSAVEGTMATFIELKKSEQGHLSALIDKQAVLLSKMIETIYGNGKPGLTVVLVSHALTLKLLVWVMSISCATTITLGIKTVWDGVSK